MSIHPVPGGPSRGRDRGADGRARAVIDARANERTDDGDDGDDWDGDVRARERARGTTVTVGSRTRGRATRRVTTKATMRFSLAPSGGVASSTMTVRVTRAKGSMEGMSARDGRAGVPWG